MTGPGEVDPRGPLHLLEGQGGGGHGQGAVVVEIQFPGPGVEELHGLDPGFDLQIEQAGGSFRQAQEPGESLLGFGVEEGLGPGPVPRTLPFDPVGKQGPGSPGEAEHGDVFGKLGLHLADGSLHGLEDPFVQGLIGVELVQGTSQARTALREGDPAAQGVQDHENVTEDDGAVQLGKAPHRQQAHLRGQVRIRQQLLEAGLLPDGPVLGQESSRLPHEPEGGRENDLPPQGSQQVLAHASSTS